MGRGRPGGKPRKHPGARGRRPDRKQLRRDEAVYRAKRRGDSDLRISQHYLPRKSA